MKATILAPVTLGLGLLAIPAVAEAATGTVTGRLQYWNRMGNYCPASRDCSGAKYAAAQWNQPLGVAHVKVLVRNAATNAVIGQGVTTSTGNFNVTWTATPAPAQASITWHAEHKDGRFAVRTSSGGTWTMWTYPFDLAPSGATNAGAPTWGSSTAPHELAHVYAGAWRTWWDSFWWSNLLWAHFDDVEIRFGTPDCGGSTLGCSDCPSNTVWIGPGIGFNPLLGVGHEMSHIASCRASVNQDRWSCAKYDWACTGCDASWSLNSEEWHRAGFEEGLANFLAVVAFYEPWAPSPAICGAQQGSCPAANVETRFESCDIPGDNDPPRWPLSTTRALWDTFDSVADTPPGSSTDTFSAGYDAFTETIEAFPDGRCDGCKNEGYDCFIVEDPGWCWLANGDGRSPDDFVSNWSSRWGQNISGVWSANCL